MPLSLWVKRGVELFNPFWFWNVNALTSNLGCICGVAQLGAKCGRAEKRSHCEGYCASCTSPHWSGPNMAFRKLAGTNSQGAQSSSNSSGEKGKLRDSEREGFRGSNEIRFLAGEDEKISKTQSEYHPAKASSILWWKKSKDEKDIGASEPRYADYKKTHRKGVSRPYKREVVCPKCKLKVSSFSTDFVRCRRCGLEYIFPHLDRPFERDENEANRSKEAGETSSQSGSELLKRK